MADVAAALLESMRAFGCGAPQEDDVTAVLIRREPARSAQFARTFDSLDAIFAFIDATFAAFGADDSLRPAVELAVEELFTNMVKHGKGEGEIVLQLSRIPRGIEATLVDHGAAPFDVTQAPAARVDLPLDEREAGGLGLHLVRRMVDRIVYEYLEDLRETRITIRKTSGGGGHVQD